MSTGPIARRSGERDQYWLLCRAFLQRLFENDLVPDSVDLRQSAIWLTAIFAVPPALYAVPLLLRFVSWMTPQETAVAAVPFKLFFVGYAMAAVGFLTVLVWDALYPDRRDSVVLGTVPVRARTVVAAKISAVVGLVFCFAVIINVPAAMVFSFAAGGYGPVGLLARGLAGHLLATVSAGMFVFFSLLALQAGMAALLPHGLRRAVSVVAQLLFAIVLIEWVIYSPGVLQRLIDVSAVTPEPNLAIINPYGFFAGILSDGAGSWLPPLWFLGVYEVVWGFQLRAYLDVATTGAFALTIALGLAGIAYAASFRRMVRDALESPQQTGSSSGRWGRVVDRIARATILRHPVERAVVAFAIKSLTRSRRHRLLIAIYVGVGLAFVIGSFLRPYVRDGITISLDEPSAALLSIPFVLSFFLLVALRVLFSVPTEIRANWIFQMTESRDKSAYVGGVRKAQLILGTLPIAAVLLPLYAVLWGPIVAGGHVIFWLLLAALLSELLLLRFHKVPFTCSYIPGKANMKLLWPVYVVVLTTYSYSTARLEVWLLADWARWIVACGTVAACLAATIVHRRRATALAPQLCYEETQDASVQVLGLMRQV